MEFTEMIYDRNKESSYVLYQKDYGEGVKGVVINVRHDHMCAYVTFPRINLLEDYNFLDLQGEVFPHGGFTFLGRLENCGVDDGLIYIGWDYAHLGDFRSYGSLPDDYKWSVQEVIAELDQIAEELKNKKYNMYREVITMEEIPW